MFKKFIGGKLAFLACLTLLISIGRVYFMPSQAIAAGHASASAMMSDTILSDVEFAELYSAKLGIQLDSCNIDKPLLIYITSWLGTPYRYAGTTRMGVDCSGLVSAIFRDIYDIQLPHSSAGMLPQMKERVQKSDLKRGDIVFFKINKTRISHVGICIGDNKFVHASSYRGVVIDDLGAPYYSRYYYTAGRVL